VVLSEALAARLAVHPGDLVELEITQGRHPRVLVPVTAVAQDYAGLIAHISRTALNRILGDGDVVSGANLTVIADRRGEFYRAITRTPELTGTASRDDTVTMFRAAVTSVMQTEMLFFLGFAAAIAFGIAYNVSRIALADRARDLATLRVLGFEPYECAYILSGELVLLALVATPIGAVGGVGLASALLAAFRRQNFFMPLTIAPHAFGIAFATYLGAVLLAAGMAAQRVWRFDLVAVLKTRE
jgi:putative ABC transport system permease protein